MAATSLLSFAQKNTARSISSRSAVAHRDCYPLCRDLTAEDPIGRVMENGSTSIPTGEANRFNYGRYQSTEAPLSRSQRMAACLPPNLPTDAPFTMRRSSRQVYIRCRCRAEKKNAFWIEAPAAPAGLTGHLPGTVFIFAMQRNRRTMTI